MDYRYIIATLATSLLQASFYSKGASPGISGPRIVGEIICEPMFNIYIYILYIIYIHTSIFTAHIYIYIDLQLLENTVPCGLDYLML